VAAPVAGPDRLEDRVTHRRSTLLALVAVAAAFLAQRAGAEQPPAPKPVEKPPNKGSVSDAVKWDLGRLNQEPVKLIKATPDARTGLVRFLLEFTRAPKASELYDWEQRGGVVLFKFLDEEGVAIRAVRPQWEGDLAPKKGTRMRLILQLPDEATLNLTHSVVAE
jgi:hypothetical protein